MSQQGEMFAAGRREFRSAPYRLEVYSDDRRRVPASGVMFVKVRDGLPVMLTLDCPCGCGIGIELRLNGVRTPDGPPEEATWDGKIENGKFTMHPSLVRQVGPLTNGRLACSIHIWIRDNCCVKC